MNAWIFVYILLAIFIILFVVALLMPNKTGTLKELYLLTKSQLTAPYLADLAHKYIVIYQNGNKVALISLDNDLKTHQRKMGELKIYNFKYLPNEKQLKKALNQLLLTN